jgi:hypothetical protein
MDEVLQLIDDYRYIGAFDKYQTILQDLQSGQLPLEVKEEWETKIAQNKQVIDTMLARAQEVEDTIARKENQTEWIFALQMFGISTYYQLDTKSNEIKIKLEGEMEDLPLFEQCAVIHEVDLFKEWIPFCRESINVAKLGRAELLPYLTIGLPGFNRDFALIAYGADCMIERGKFLIIGKPVESYPGLTIPFKEEGWFHKRMVLQEFLTIVDLLTPTSAKVKNRIYLIFYFLIVFCYYYNYFFYVNVDVYYLF